MLDDLTAAEIVSMVQIFKAIPENVMVFNENGELTMLENLDSVKSLAEKLNEAGEREDVKAYIDEHYGGSDEE